MEQTQEHEMSNSNHPILPGDSDVLTGLTSTNLNEEAISGLTTTPLQVIFNDLRYTVKVARPVEGNSGGVFKNKTTLTDKPILHGVKGVFSPGRLTAIMGASGSGKTSLLNLVAGQTSVIPVNSVLGGEIIVNGLSLPLKDKRLTKICGYVQQDDVILETMTVREAITMAALLRLPQTMTRDAKLQRVEHVIKLLHLEKCAESVIGSHLVKGISGGERKRVAVAMVMITNPSILYLDEPTSGLDAFTAYSIIKTLRNVARTGRTVAATIHQPSSDIVQLFDDLILLSEGRIIYHGPMDHMVNYFGTLGFRCPKYSNPADYLFMSILNDVRSNTDPKKSKTEADSGLVKGRLEMFQREWLKSSEYQKYVEDPSQHPGSGGVKTSDVVERAPFVTQFQLLAQRAFKNAIRNKLIVKGRAGQTIILGIIMGLVFLQIPDDQRGVQNRGGALFMLVANSMMSSCMGALTVFATEKVVFLREYQSGMYRLPAYFLSRILVELPFKIIFPTLFAIITYFLMGFQHVASKFFIFMFTILLAENTGHALGLFVACFFSDIAVALTMMPLFIMPLMIFSGYFVNSSTAPVFLSWITYISPNNYAFTAVVLNEYRGLTLHCTEDQYALRNGTLECPITRGEQVIQQLDMSDKSLAGSMATLFAFFVGLSLLAYFALMRQVKKRK